MNTKGWQKCRPFYYIDWHDPGIFYPVWNSHGIKKFIRRSFTVCGSLLPLSYCPAAIKARLPDTKDHRKPGRATNAEYRSPF